jgi:predicted nucleotidyltransferase component of viral defense system
MVRTPDRVQIKIEVTLVLRGCVYEPRMMSVTESVEDTFGFAEIRFLSFADLYDGKIMAALDRQHPRDLFDVHLLRRTRAQRTSCALR